MATDPFTVRRHTDVNRLSESIQVVMEAFNRGAGRRRISARNVPGVYQFFPFRSYATAFAGLPTPGDAGVGARVVVTDVRDADAVNGFNGILTGGGGTTPLPAWSDGTYWRIG